MPFDTDHLLKQLKQLETQIAVKQAQERYVKRNWPIVLPQRIASFVAVFVGLPAFVVGLVGGMETVWRFGLFLGLLSIVLTVGMIVVLYPGWKKVSAAARQTASIPETQSDSD